MSARVAKTSFVVDQKKKLLAETNLFLWSQIHLIVQFLFAPFFIIDRNPQKLAFAIKTRWFNVPNLGNKIVTKKLLFTKNLKSKLIIQDRKYKSTNDGYQICFKNIRQRIFEKIITCLKSLIRKGLTSVWNGLYTVIMVLN